MSELLVTQCPYCQTRFRLTPEQLRVAAGNVRCGACLEVFNAGEAAVTAPPVSSTAEPAPPTPAPASSLLHDDLDDPDLQALGLDESIIDEVNPCGMTGHRQTGLEEADLADEPVTDDPLLPSSESVEAALPPEPTTKSFNDLHEDFLATPPAQDFGPDFEHNRLGIQSLRPVDDDYADHGIFRRDRPADTLDQAAAMTPSGPAETEPQTPAQAIEPTIDDEHADHDRREPLISPLLLPDLFDEPLLEEAPARRRRHPWLWGSLCLLALLALPAQFLYYNFDALARDQRSRALLENLCFIAQCELPARVDISRIRSANLLVREHPEFPNALAIDVILYNRADFEQPFPVLQMQFTDAGGRDIASRRFRPEEYLSGELAGVSLMPPQTPIHVGLSMLDPGPQANGYSLEFLSP
ncbi:MJ0042 family finger-like domain-containing protein [Halopseudomonas litoralis]|uniref:MJ0042 family finger-like domain-containing protein n=1 Tax=Halopseudomonas litoralis TaxID=797277 RepID=A0A1H1MA23_9GAMM|nr:DUF3426 domain-containing protein [Halopseudomonas litoralis]SDR82839.1 MJ0042 family finger-like domain-containing protein [Halopseudomonas litoralis]